MSGTQGQNSIILLHKICGIALCNCLSGVTLGETLVLATFGGRAIAANSIVTMPNMIPTFARTSCEADIADRTMVAVSSAHYYLGGISRLEVVRHWCGGKAIDRILTIIPLGCKAIAVDSPFAM